MPDLANVFAVDFNAKQEILAQPAKKRKRTKPIERDNTKYISKSGASVASPNAPGRPSIIVNLWGPGRIGVFIKRGQLAEGEPAHAGSPVGNFNELGHGYIQRVSASLFIPVDSSQRHRPMGKLLSAMHGVLKPRLVSDERCWATACGIWNAQVERIPKNILAVVNAVLPGPEGHQIERSKRLKLLTLLRDLPEEAIAQAKKNKRLIWRLYKIIGQDLLTRAEIRRAFTAAAVGRVADAVKAATPFLTKKERAILSNCISTGQGFSPENPIRSARNYDIAAASNHGLGMRAIHLSLMVEFVAETAQLGLLLAERDAREHLQQLRVIEAAEKPIRIVEAVGLAINDAVRVAKAAEVPLREVRAMLRNVLRVGKVDLRAHFARSLGVGPPREHMSDFPRLLQDTVRMLWYRGQDDAVAAAARRRLVMILQADRPLLALQAIHDEFVRQQPAAAQPRATRNIHLGPFRLDSSERGRVTAFQNPFIFLPRECYADEGISSVHFLNSVVALSAEAIRQDHCVWSYEDECSSLHSLILSVEINDEWYTCEFSTTVVDRTAATGKLYGYRGVLDVSELVESELVVSLALVQVEGRKLTLPEGKRKRNVITGPRAERIRAAFEQLQFYLADPRTLPWFAPKKADEVETAINRAALVAAF